MSSSQGRKSSHGRARNPAEQSLRPAPSEKELRSTLRKSKIALLFEVPFAVLSFALLFWIRELWVIFAFAVFGIIIDTVNIIWCARRLRQLRLSLELDSSTSNAHPQS